MGHRGVIGSKVVSDVSGGNGLGDAAVLFAGNGDGVEPKSDGCCGLTEKQVAVTAEENEVLAHDPDVNFQDLLDLVMQMDHILFLDP